MGFQSSTTSFGTLLDEIYQLKSEIDECKTRIESDREEFEDDIESAREKIEQIEEEIGSKEAELDAAYSDQEDYDYDSDPESADANEMMNQVGCDISGIKEAIEDLKEEKAEAETKIERLKDCLLYTSPSPRDATLSRMPSSA